MCWSAQKKAPVTWTCHLSVFRSKLACTVDTDRHQSSHFPARRVGAAIKNTYSDDEMMASVCLWHVCADGLVECRTAILKIDELGRSMTHLWRDWELMRSSTDGWKRCVCISECVCVCTGYMQRCKNSIVCIWAWKKQMLLFWPSTTIHSCNPQAYILHPGIKEHPVRICIIYATAVHILPFVFSYCTIDLCKNMLEGAADLQLLFTSTEMPTLAIWICIIPHCLVWETEG